MHSLDWLVLALSLLGVVAFGVWKTRKQRDAKSFLMGDNSLPWWTIGLSVMATQASAVTFISLPGKAFQDGMGFIQFYLGMPLAVLVVSAVIMPLFYRTKVFTAYEFLEKRFGRLPRLYTAFLFLVQRGLAAGITIYAPAIVLSTLLGWNLTLTNIFIGILVIIYTVSGGSKAVAQTQKQQMGVMMLGLFVAAALLMVGISNHMPLSDGLSMAGMTGKFNLIDLKPDFSSRYNIWSGILGGFFLSLSYFGTDQSQVGRYIGGKDIRQSRMGLLFNALFKIPMQLLVLFVGVLVFVFFQFNPQPIHYNAPQLDLLRASDEARPALLQSEADYRAVVAKKQQLQEAWEAGQLSDSDFGPAYRGQLQKEQSIRQEVRDLVESHIPEGDPNDSDYIFLSYIMGYLPVGLVGLLLAMIFSGAMSSTAGELNALGSVTAIDFIQTFGLMPSSGKGQLRVSRLATAAWGVLAIVFATIFSLFDNLIEAVNIIGSLFYGTILGIFCVAFFMRWVGGRAVLWAGLIAEAFVLLVYFGTETLSLAFGWDLKAPAYLWLNPIGCLLTMLLAALLQPFMPKPAATIE